ncbi:MAG: hypothetical protein IH611_06110 [Deltaproteobacteria bacterium]|nr:hypothetical protein [Deltaproteobacteria bacterium]
MDHATAYAQVLSSESYRHRVAPDAESANRIRLAARWLIDNSDLDGDGKKGWGFPFAWDAFGDNSVNPVNHAYTIDTAIVLLGLLDALDTVGIWSQAERQEIVDLVKEVLATWSTVYWTQAAEGNGYFWYSTCVADSYNVLNVSAMLCGVLQRFLHDFGSGLTAGEAELFGSRADDGIRLIESEVILFEGKPFWDYAESPGLATNTNDLVHHVYILYGTWMYRHFGGDVPLRWTTEDALGSARLFTSGGVTYNYPHDPFFTNARISLDAPANLWGLGMLIAYAAAMDEESLAESAVRTIKASYGDYPDMTLFPPSWSSDTRIYPRFTAHVLFGLAVRDFGRE